jgi:hypothetical protein
MQPLWAPLRPGSAPQTELHKNVSLLNRSAGQSENLGLPSIFTQRGFFNPWTKKTFWRLQEKARALDKELTDLLIKTEHVRAERFVYLMALLQAGIEMSEHFGKKL